MDNIDTNDLHVTSFSHVLAYDLLFSEGMETPNRKETLGEILRRAKSRSMCEKNQVGAVLLIGAGVDDGVNKYVAFVGHNVTSHNKPCSCKRAECAPGERYDLCGAIHAEEVVLMLAANAGYRTNGAVLYTTNKPCHLCEQRIRLSGVRNTIYPKSANDTFAFDNAIFGPNVNYIELKGVEEDD